jgi:hypothetical protein
MKEIKDTQFYRVSVLRTFVIHSITVPVPLSSVIKSRFPFRYGKKLRFRFRNTLYIIRSWYAELNDLRHWTWQQWCRLQLRACGAGQPCVQGGRGQTNKPCVQGGRGQTNNQCCVSGYRILCCLFDLWIRDPGWVKIKIQIRDPRWTSRITFPSA